MKKASTESVSLEGFLANNCKATRAKYAAELEHANGEWQRPLDFRYAESLVYFGLLERNVIAHFSGPHIRGSHSEYKKAA